MYYWFTCNLVKTDTTHAGVPSLPPGFPHFLYISTIPFFSSYLFIKTILCKYQDYSMQRPRPFYAKAKTVLCKGQNRSVQRPRPFCAKANTIFAKAKLDKEHSSLTAKNSFPAFVQEFINNCSRFKNSLLWICHVTPSIELYTDSW